MLIGVGTRRRLTASYHPAPRGLVAAMLASRDFKGIRRKKLPFFMLGADCQMARNDEILEVFAK
jgi:hypothetical protein